MTPEFNRWWDADELTQTNPYTEDTPIWWAWEGWQAAQRAIVDCNTCANRGRIDGLSQETHCEHCKWQERWRTDHYAHNVKVRGPEAALSPEAPSRLTGSASEPYHED